MDYIYLIFIHNNIDIMAKTTATTLVMTDEELLSLHLTQSVPLEA
jgi:hypothetical protein